MPLHFANEQEYYSRIYGHSDHQSKHHHHHQQQQPHYHSRGISSHDLQQGTDDDAVDRYPNLTKSFQNNFRSHSSPGGYDNDHNLHNSQYNNRSQQYHPRAHEKVVRFEEHEEEVKDDKEEFEYIEESVDTEADGYIKRKHKLFEQLKTRFY